MKTIQDIQNFVDAFATWAAAQRDVQGVALVGSYARGAARDDSDIDLVILTDQFPKYIEDRQWAELFGVVEKVQAEDYDKCPYISLAFLDINLTKPSPLNKSVQVMSSLLA
jgi:predicted nucleotidyltransferase